MPLLADLQQALLSDIYTDSTESLAYLDGRISGVEERLHIYKNNTRLNLMETLKSIYPIVCDLVGDEFFKTMARHYIKQVPLHVGDRNQYGAGFADFIDGFSAAKTVPYLADMARLEWGYFYVGLQPKNKALTAHDLQRSLQEDQETFLHVGSHVLLLNLSSNVHELFDFYQCDNANIQSFALSFGPVYLMLYKRENMSVSIERIHADVYAFLQGVKAGKSFADVMQNAVDKGCDIAHLQQAFGQLMQQGAFCKTPMVLAP